MAPLRAHLRLPLHEDPHRRALRQRSLREALADQAATLGVALDALEISDASASRTAGYSVSVADDM